MGFGIFKQLLYHTEDRYRDTGLWCRVVRTFISPEDRSTDNPDQERRRNNEGLAKEGQSEVNLTYYT